MRPATQIQAYREIQQHAEVYRRRVLEYLQRCGHQGSTDEEGILATGFNRNTYPPRRTELSQMGSVVDSGKRRKTLSGKYAIVWIAASFEETSVRQVGLL